MRVELPSVAKNRITSEEAFDKKDFVKNSVSKINDVSKTGEIDKTSLTGSQGIFRMGGAYSVASLKAAANYHEKSLMVAASNLLAAQSVPEIPEAILRHFNK